jgi:hypothetical protein
METNEMRKAPFMQEYKDEIYKMLSDLRDANLQFRKTLEDIDKIHPSEEEPVEEISKEPSMICEVLIKQKCLLNTQIKYFRENLEILSKFI